MRDPAIREEASVSLRRQLGDDYYTRVRRRYKIATIFFLITFFSSLVVGLLSARFGLHSKIVAHNGLIDWLSYLVPSVGAIPRYARNPSTAIWIYGLQWFFSPFYFACLFIGFMPISNAMKLGITAVTQQNRHFNLKRTLIVSVGLIFLTFYLLGDLGVVHFPTFYNGYIVSPPSEATILHIIYRSNVALALYGVVAVVAECFCWWAFSVLIFNFKSFIVLKKR